MYKTTSVVAIVSTLLLSACVAPQYGAQPYPSNAYPAYSSYPASSYPASYPAAQPQYASFGVIDSIQRVQAPVAGGVGAGAIVGGVAGGLLGNQVSKGSGRTAATVVGAIGGTIVGNQIEQNNVRGQMRELYQIAVRMDNGGFQTIVQDPTADLAPGVRVRVENNHVYRY